MPGPEAAEIGDLVTQQLLGPDVTAPQIATPCQLAGTLIAENVSDVIWVFNVTKAKMTYVSPSIQQLRGITVEDAMAENIEKRSSPNHGFS